MNRPPSRLVRLRPTAALGVVCCGVGLLHSVAHGRQQSICGGWTGFGLGIERQSEYAADPEVRVLHTAQLPGAGQLLIAGGYFAVRPAPASAPIYGLAAWNGTNWTSIGDFPGNARPLTGTDSGTINALLDADGSAGTGLIAAGNFDRVRCPGGSPQCAGEVAAKSIARWDGARWYPLGAGFQSIYLGDSPGTIFGLARLGTDLYAWGDGAFLDSAGTPIPGFARWNGVHWSSVAGFPGYAWLDDGSPEVHGLAGSIVDVAVVGSQLFVLAEKGNLEAPRLWLWNGTIWSEVFPPSPRSMWSTKQGLEVYDAGSGPRLYASVIDSGVDAPSGTTVIFGYPSGVTSASLGALIQATGFAWRIRDHATGIELQLSPGYFFNMGCSPSNQHPCLAAESPVHQVTLTNPFYLGRYEVTQAEWQRRMGTNPSFFQGPAYPDASSRPVDRVSWDMVQTFLAGSGLRLPTEAEWEFAYRGGAPTAFHAMPTQLNGTNDDSLAGNIAWFSGNNGAAGSATYGTKAVGRKSSNTLGYFDMSGNVWEWVQDNYLSTYYASSPSVDPPGPSTGTNRVMRGGSWFNDSDSIRASYRAPVPPGDPFGGVNGVMGFRVARSVSPSGATPYSGTVRLDGALGTQDAWTRLGTVESKQEFLTQRLDAIAAGPYQGLYLISECLAAQDPSCVLVARLDERPGTPPLWRSLDAIRSLPVLEANDESETYAAVLDVHGWYESFIAAGSWTGGLGPSPAPSFNGMASWSEGRGTWSVPDAAASLTGTVFALAANLPATGGWQPSGASLVAGGAIVSPDSPGGLNAVRAMVDGGWESVTALQRSNPSSGFNGTVYALAPARQSPIGPSLFAGGNFTRVDGAAISSIACWNGSSWVAVGAGLNGMVWSLDEGEADAFGGSGVRRLVAGGAFTQSGAAAVKRVALWNGLAWQPLGAGLDGGSVFVVRILYDGTGYALYAGGSFLSSGGTSVSRIARWDGTAWRGLGSGVDGSVLALESLAIGGRNLIVVGGNFTTAGGQTANRIAAWDQQLGTWQPLGTGANERVMCLASAQTSEGPRLYAGGLFTTMGGVEAQRFAIWDGSGWIPPEALGLPSGAMAMQTVSDETAVSVMIGGSFTSSPSGLSHLAEWRACLPACDADLDGDGKVDSADLALLLSSWGPATIADLNADGLVDSSDLSILLSSWGSCS